MALENLKQNVKEEKEIIREALLFASQLQHTVGKEREMLIRTLNSLLATLRIVNGSIPKLLENISPVKKLEKTANEKREKAERVKGLINLKYEKGKTGKAVTIEESEKEKFLEELRLVDFAAKKIKSEKEIRFEQFKKPSAYAKLANKFFFKSATNLLERGKFKALNKDLRKANSPFIINTYVSIMLFSTLLAAIFSVILSGILIIMGVNIIYAILLFFAIPVLAFTAIYFYPYTEKKSIGRKIEHELPFVVIHMSAIAGSGIEPTQIFKIIVSGKEYPYMKREIRKVVNQVNFFGYDLVSALRSSASTTSSNKLAELYNGFATTIASGGNLADFFDKRAETLLLDYKLEKEKATKMAESFMNIYISVVIAAPMIMMLLMILMNVGVVGAGLSLNTIAVIIVSAVALINIVFLGFLQLKQQAY